MQRILAYYSDRGYPNAKVVSVDAQLNDAKDKVDITVDLAEGEPVIVESISFEGLDELPPDHLEQLRRQLPISAGSPRDQRLILASHDMVVAELRDHGFPYGTVRALERSGSGPLGVQLSLAAETGPKAVFGAITVEGDVSVEEEVIRRELAFNEGDLYQLSRITETQRRIYGLELFQFVNVTPRLPEDRSPRIPVLVTVAEGKHRRLLFAAGYGSEERARGRINWRHVNFFGGARTGEVEAKASKLEQGVRGSFVEPYLFRRGLSLRASASTWWADEPVYEYWSSGGRVTFSQDFSRAGAGTLRGVRNVLSASIIQEYEDYVVAPEVLADPTYRDELIALGLDPETGRGTGTVAALAIDFERNTSTQPLNPRQGYVVSGHVERANQWLRGTFDYTEVIGEARDLPAPRIAVRVGEPRARWNARWTKRCAHPVLQTLFRRRFDERARMGPLPGEPVDPGGQSHRRPLDVGVVYRGEIHHSRQASGRAVRGWRQFVGRRMERATQ